MTSPTNLTAEEIYSAAAASGARPDPLLRISEWADRYRWVSQRSAAEHGRWRTERTPYLAEIMDCLSPSSLIERVVMMKGAQIGGTEVGNNWLAFIIHMAPGPMMAVQPTIEMAKRNSKQRIEPLVEESEVLRKLVRDPRSRDSGNTILSKDFPGGVLVMTGANSAVGLRSMAARYLFLDEVDAYPGDVEGEGDPVTLALARTRTFARRKIFMVSTPKIGGMSRIEAAYEESDQRRYWVPCPTCNEFQTLKFPNLRWPKDDPRSAVYVCEYCDAEIHDHQKHWMLARGEWRAAASGDGRTAGFHISSMYSPVGWFSWGDAAQQFEQAQKNTSLLQVFVNTVLGETWRESGRTLDWRRLYDRAEDYQIGTCPAGVRVLFAGADVQKDRIEVFVYGYGDNLEQWFIDHIIIDGSVYADSTWTRLSDLMSVSYPTTSGTKLPILTLGIDSGFEAPLVYKWAERWPIDRVKVLKGRRDGNTYLERGNPIDILSRAGARTTHHTLYFASTTLLKDQLYGWLSADAPTREQLAEGQAFPVGFLHVPHLSEDYFRQLTSESKVKGVYEKIHYERNEALDCKCYADAIAWLRGTQRYHAAGAALPTVTKAPPQVQQRPQSQQRRIRGRFGGF